MELAGASFEDFPWFWSLLVLFLKACLCFFFGGLELAYAFFRGFGACLCFFLVVWGLLMLFLGGLLMLFSKRISNPKQWKIPWFRPKKSISKPPKKA